ncbi:hypothetical protein NUU61_005682 [Penicillium alfredii]|uniref:Zn(2)-C6 fungal-type domain-containing protein n=1 Tax=Penicillium alfredii TaxID=1506179 RepID=A0A9W9FA15_9EURO|nr:uncharacterized protein NUU61_005682 [Penicillium alfredii]KAJ5096326.1 hypothetical protein NUU61_005682 [Penicillium alfredii]
MALRRPHRKSRHGCVECKRRRVKVCIGATHILHRLAPTNSDFPQCDEVRPTCSNCAKRHAECEYGSSTSLLWANDEPGRSSLASGSDSGPHSSPVLGSPNTDSLGILGRLSGDNAASTLPSPALNLHDLELMMQWCNATYHTLSRNELTDPIWRNIVPDEALSHSFLMHGILALSALHLARTGPEPSRRAGYLNRAVAHQNQALALFRELLGDITDANAKAMFAFASIVVVYTFGFPHTPDAQDAWTCVDDLYQVLILTRGIQQVIRSPADCLRDSQFAPILQVEEVHAFLSEDATVTIKRLHEANENYGAHHSTHDREVYQETINNFAEMLSWVQGGMTASTVAGRWAIRLPQRFLELLRQREPLALVMLAHYGVLLRYLKHRWCFDEWCVRVAKAVWAILDRRWRPLVDWAMREILGANYVDEIDGSVLQ